jgi:outer membrane protein OmpA-like peptidoglycan-associated protein
MSRIACALVGLIVIGLCVQAHAQNSATLANQQKIRELKSRLNKLSGDDDGEVPRLNEIIRQQRDTIKWLKGNKPPEQLHYERHANVGKCDCIRIYYDLDKNTANYARYPLLDSIALLAKADESLLIKLEGHADWRGNHNADETLALKRAHDLKTYLQHKYQISPDRIVVTSNVNREAIEEVTDPNLVHLSRRVEVSILRQ